MNTNLVKTVIDDLKCPSEVWRYHAKNLANYSEDKYDDVLLETLVSSVSTQGSLKSYEGKDLISCVIAKKDGDTSWTFTYNSINRDETYERIKAIKRWMKKTVKKLMGKNPYVLTAEISLEDAIIKYEHATVDSLGNNVKGYYNIHKKGALGNIVRTAQFDEYDHHYHDNLLYCVVKLHFHFECKEAHYKGFQKDTKDLRKFTTHNLYMCKSASGMDTDTKVEKTANYVTKLNSVARESSVRNGRFKFDVPVYDEESAKTRARWLRVLKPITNIENTDKQALKDVARIQHVQNKKKEERQAKITRHVEKIEKQKRLAERNKPLFRFYTEEKQSSYNTISKNNRALFTALDIQKKTVNNRKQKQFCEFQEAAPTKWTIYNVYDVPMVTYKGNGPPSISAV